MSKETGKSLELASDRFLARDRMPIFLGQDMPQTIAMKEIIDNEIDIVSERGQKANKAIIYISPNRLKVMDNGTGISAEDDVEGKPSIWHACATMFSSSNYSKNSQDTIGANGVGMTLANYTSAKFSILNFNGKNVKGYSFTDGYLNGDKDTEKVPESISSLPSGDFVNNPLSFDEANALFEPFFGNGFLVDVTWHESGTENSLFHDKADINWLINYAKIRCGEMTSGEIEIHTFEDNEFTKPKNTFIWNKDKNSEYYRPNWEEQVKEHGCELIKDGPWIFAFNINEMKIDSICQSAPITSRYKHGLNIQIQDYNVAVEVPFSMRYLSDEYPNYTDQTKVSVRFPYSAVSRAFEKTGNVYKHFYREAEKAYMAKVIKDSDSNMFWPSLGDPRESELIIAEGYSAISGLKSQRDPMTQACIALRGKILNTWNLDMQKAMKAEIVKQILNAVIYTPYKKIIIATDEDTDGHHIAGLLLALFARFTNLIQDGKVYRVHSPLFLFKARGKETLFSDKESDKPQGYTSHRNKGLGSLTAEEVHKFVMDPYTRELIPIRWDEKSYDMLDLAFSRGGEDWILI